MADAWEYAGEEWKGDLDGEAEARDVAKADRRLRIWFLQRVDIMAGCKDKTFLEGRKEHDTPEVAEACLEWFWEHRERFLRWVPCDQYHGAGYSAGAWVIDAEAVAAAGCFAIRATQSLAKQVDFALWYLTRFPNSVCPVRERAAWTLVSGRSAFYRRQRRIAARWPRPCASCQKEFRPDRQGKHYCNACRNAARALAAAARAKRKEAQ